MQAFSVRPWLSWNLLYTMLASNSEAWLCLLSAGITGMRHYHSVINLMPDLKSSIQEAETGVSPVLGWPLPHSITSRPAWDTL